MEWNRAKLVPLQPALHQMNTSHRRTHTILWSASWKVEGGRNKGMLGFCCWIDAGIQLLLVSMLPSVGMIVHKIEDVSSDEECHGDK